MLVKLIILSVILVTSAEKITYQNYASYDVLPQSEKDLAYLGDLYRIPDGLKFFSAPTLVGEYVSVIAPPDLKKKFEESLSANNIEYEVTSNDIQKILDAEKPNRRKRSTDDNEVYFDTCLTLNNIYNYFDYLSTNRSDIVSKITIGESFEGRSIPGIKISRGSPKRAFVLAGGEIGADCLSPTFLTYITRELIEGDDPEALAASEEFEWHIIPVINPDGFVYSQNFDRLWIKNRRQDQLVPNGVDLTKNWNSYWGIHGGSYDNSHDNYIGPGPFSEPETRDVSAYITTLGPRLSGLLSFRTFGQRLLIPFAHTTAQLYNYEEMITIARRSLGSLSVKYNTQYLAGTPREFTDSYTGTIGDWVKYRFNPPIVATYLLRNTHNLNPNLVLPACEETYDSVMAILREGKFIDVI
ncbi:zinc carboxypeptidase [Aphomia sociella]